MRKTRHYKLPLFDSNDQPKWLVDWNEAMAKIDYAIHVATTGDPDVPDISELYGMIQELQTLTNGIVNNLYSEYDSTRAYEKNDFCTHNGELYICTEETFVGDVFNPYNWSSANITAKLTECINTFEKLLSTIGWIFDTDTNYSVNDFVWHNGEFYKFIQQYTAGDGWQDSYVIPANLGAETSNLLNRVTVLEQSATTELKPSGDYTLNSLQYMFNQISTTDNTTPQCPIPVTSVCEFNRGTGDVQWSLTYGGEVTDPSTWYNVVKAQTPQPFKDMKVSVWDYTQQTSVEKTVSEVINDDDLVLINITPGYGLPNVIGSFGFDYISTGTVDFPYPIQTRLLELVEPNSDNSFNFDVLRIDKIISSDNGKQMYTQSMRSNPQTSNSEYINLPAIKSLDSNTVHLFTDKNNPKPYYISELTRFGDIKNNTVDFNKWNNVGDRLYAQKFLKYYINRDFKDPVIYDQNGTNVLQDNGWIYFTQTLNFQVQFYVLGNYYKNKFRVDM